MQAGDQRDRDHRLAARRVVVVQRNRCAGPALFRRAARAPARASLINLDVVARAGGRQLPAGSAARAGQLRKARTVSQTRSTSLGSRLLMQRQADHPAGLARGHRHVAAAALERRLLEQVRDSARWSRCSARGELRAQAVALGRPAPGSAGCTRRSRRCSGAASARSAPGPRAGGSSARPARRAGATISSSRSMLGERDRGGEIVDLVLVADPRDLLGRAHALRHGAVVGVGGEARGRPAG